MNVAIGRAELYLLKLALSGGRYRDGPVPRGLVGEQVDARRSERFERVARLFVDAGALRSDDVEVLRGRLAESLGGDTAPLVVDEELVVGARALLARRLDELANAIAAQRAAVQVDAARARVWQTHWAVEKCRVLSSDERRQWLKRLCEIDPDATRSLQLARTPTLADLRCVVAGGTSGDGAIRVVCAELYADAVLLRWQSRGAPPPAPRERQPDVVLSDDVGTTYVHVSTARRAHHARAYTAGRSLFCTPAPPSARTLIADLAGQRLAFALPPERGGS